MVLRIGTDHTVDADRKEQSNVLTRRVLNLMCAEEFGLVEN